MHTQTNNKIIIWPSSFLPVIGGLQSATLEIGKYLTEKGWNVQIITNRYPQNLESYEILSDLTVNRYTFLVSPFQYLRSGRIDLFFAWIFYKPLTFIRLLITFIHFKPKVVNLHFPDHQLFECYVLFLLFRFKLIISLHGNEVERINKLSKRSIRYYIYNKLFKSADGITGCSKFLINQFQMEFKEINADKCFVIYNGVAEDFLKKELENNKSDYVFSAARFTPIKGLDLIVKLVHTNSINHLMIAGGDENDFLELEIPISDSITFLGSLSQSEIAQYLSRAKLTVIPSRSETYGIIAAEALCCGSPIVATNVGGIPEVIFLARCKLNQVEKDIFDSWVRLVNPDSESIRKGINYLMNNNSNIEEYLNLIPKVCRQFTWAKMLVNYNKLIGKQY